MNKWFMAGTEGTGQYIVFLATALGRLGVRMLSGGKARVRVEPTSAEAAQKIASHLTRNSGWKQPGDDSQARFSTVTGGDAGLREKVQSAIHGLANIGGGFMESLEMNPAAPSWVRELAGMAPATPVVPTPAPAVPVVVTAPSAIVVEGSDPQALRAEAQLLREEAADLREKARRAGERAEELIAKAAAYEARATAIEKALVEFNSAKSRVKALGVPLPNGGGALGEQLNRLPKATLVSVAKGMGLTVAPKATKAQIVAAIIG